jgi:hypothetical protein
MNAATIDAHVLIPDMLEAAPQLRPILDRYGLRGCGGLQGPVETLAFFAKAHDVPLERLLQELRAGLAAPVTTTPTPSQADTIYRPFFKAGIAVALTLGAVWGALLLLRIAFRGTFGAAGIHEVNAHGHAQIFGWVGLFVMGFAYQAFPRFKHTALACPQWARASLWILLTGIVTRSICEPLAESVAWMGPLAVAAAVLEVTAIGIFVMVLAATWGRAGKRLEFYDAYIVSALFWFFVQVIYEAVYLAATFTITDQSELLPLVAAWQAPLRDIQIHGFALLMILGVSQRFFHNFYGFPPPNRRVSKMALVALNLAVIGEASGLILMRASGHAWATLWYASVLALTAASGWLVTTWRLASAPEECQRRAGGHGTGAVGRASLANHGRPRPSPVAGPPLSRGRHSRHWERGDFAHAPGWGCPQSQSGAAADLCAVWLPAADKPRVAADTCPGHHDSSRLPPPGSGYDRLAGRPQCGAQSSST